MWEMLGLAGILAVGTTTIIGLTVFLNKDKCTKCGSRRLKELKRNMIRSWKTKEMRLRNYTDYTTNYDKNNKVVGHGETSRKVREPATVTA